VKQVLGQNPENQKWSVKRHFEAKPAKKFIVSIIFEVANLISTKFGKQIWVGKDSFGKSGPQT